MIFPADDAIIDAPRATALFSAAASVSEANIWTSVNGWSVARVFTSLEREYRSAKNEAVIADLGPIARYAVRGGDAGAFLARVTTAPAVRLEPGESARGLILDDRGEVIDLAEVSRLSADLFLLTTPKAHPRRLQLAARGCDVAADDITGQVAALGVFGPEAAAVLSAAGVKAPTDIIAGSDILRGVETATRPIQFGALPGVELIFPKDEALTFWERLVRRSGVGAIGLDALEVLRLESGTPRSGVDFIAADRAPPDGARTPAELGLAHLAPLDRGWFNGRRGLRKKMRVSIRRLTSLSVDGEELTPGAAVFVGDKTVGEITSCAWSPTLKRIIAFADIANAAMKKNCEKITVSTPTGGRVAAGPLETAESALANAFLNI